MSLVDKIKKLIDKYFRARAEITSGQDYIVVTVYLGIKLFSIKINLLNGVVTGWEIL